MDWTAFGETKTLSLGVQAQVGQLIPKLDPFKGGTLP